MKIMLIPREFDVAMSERRKIAERVAIDTCDKLNKRVLNFLSDIEKNPLLNSVKKKEIRARLLQNI